MSKQRIIFTSVAVLLVLGAGMLLLADPKAPQNPVEKQLDAKTFLEQKQ